MLCPITGWIIQIIPFNFDCETLQMAPNKQQGLELGSNIYE